LDEVEPLSGGETLFGAAQSSIGSQQFGFLQSLLSQQVAQAAA
jgi:hypothetical protein